MQIPHISALGTKVNFLHHKCYILYVTRFICVLKRTVIIDRTNFQRKITDLK